MHFSSPRCLIRWHQVSSGCYRNRQLLLHCKKQIYALEWNVWEHTCSKLISSSVSLVFNEYNRDYFPQKTHSYLRCWNEFYAYIFSLNKHQLTEMFNARAMVTMAGLVRVSFVEELSTGCETRPALFPFDRMSCAIHMALGSTVARQPSSLGPSSSVLLPSASPPTLNVQGMTSWEACRLLKYNFEC
jgi:hypothetical protein